MDRALVSGRRRWWDFLPFLLFLVAFLHPALFAFDDDFYILRKMRWDTFPWFNNTVVAEGRPLYAIYLKIAYSLVGSLDNILWLRLIGLAGVIVASETFARFLDRELRIPPLLARVGVTLLFLCPGIGIYTFWGVTSPFPWGMALAIVAGSMVWRGWFDPRKHWRRVLGGLFLALLSEFIYQPTAGFFLAPILAAVVVRRDSPALRAAAAAFLSFAFLIGLYFVLFKLSGALFFSGSQNADRGGHLALANVFHYLNVVIPVAAAGWAYFWTGPWAHLFQALLVAATILWIAREVRRDGLLLAGSKVGLWIVALVLVGAPIIGSGAYTPARTHSAITAILLLPAFAGGWIALRRLSAPSLRWTAIATVAIAWTWLARYIMIETVIEPVTREFQTTREMLAHEIDGMPRSLTLVVPAIELRKTHLSPQFEYSGSTLRANWLTECMLLVMVAEHLEMEPDSPLRRYLFDLMPILIRRPPFGPEIFAWGPTINLPRGLGRSDAPVMRPESEGTPRRVRRAPFGEIEEHPSGWLHIEKLGHLLPNPKSADWLQHPNLGSIRVLSWNDDGFYFYSQAFGRITGYQANWPWMRLFDYDRRPLDLDHFNATLGDPKGYAAEILQVIENAPREQRRSDEGLISRSRASDQSVMVVGKKPRGLSSRHRSLVTPTLVPFRTPHSSFIILSPLLRSANHSPSLARDEIPLARGLELGAV